MTETAIVLRKKKVTQGRLFTNKVSLRGSKPPIWRRLVMAASSTLAELHFAIQSSMGWGSCHLHAFEIDGRTYGDRSATDDVTDERRLSLNGIANAGVHRFSYIYDFGDNWEHVVTIEKIAFADTPYRAPSASQANGHVLRTTAAASGATTSSLKGSLTPATPNMPT